MPNPIVHFEIPASDPKKVIGFYTKVFDWRIEPAGNGGDYWTVRTFNGDGPGLNGGLMLRTGPTQTPINYVQVAALDDTLKRIEERGGRILHVKQPKQGVGWFAIAVDPEGNPFGLFQPDAAAPAEEAVQPPAS